MDTLDTQPAVSVQSLVVFPAFILEISIRNQKDIDRLESLCRSDPTNPIGDRILNALHVWMLDMFGSDANFKAWLAAKDTQKYQAFLSYYKDKKAADDGKETGSAE